MDKKKELLRQIPKIDEVLKDQRLFAFFEDPARSLIVEAVREEIESLRSRILNGKEDEPDPDALIGRILKRITKTQEKSLRRVINATGTIIHTNLGRSRLSEEVCRSVLEAAAGYSTLEYDLSRGARGSRHEHVEKLLARITGTEAAMAVNNNAAAVLLCLSALAEGKDVLVSRGELVEIGGSFRIPEIMEQGGVNLVEVGTTNKTYIEDYRRAIVHDKTGILLKVHTSNYKIMGFTAEASLSELAELGRDNDIPVVYDMGSGLLADLSKYGIDEPTVQDSIKSGIDVILFSGDKLLGGPQAGIIAGKKEYIDKMKKHPLARVVRLDKMTLAALEATFRIYLDPDRIAERIPTLSMITKSRENLRKSADNFALSLRERTGEYFVQVVEADGQVGGGSTPNQFIPGYAAAITSNKMSPDKIERGLRSYQTPVIARIYKDQILIDMRTVAEDEVHIIVEALVYLAQKTSAGGKHDA